MLNASPELKAAEKPYEEWTEERRTLIEVLDAADKCGDETTFAETAQRLRIHFDNYRNHLVRYVSDLMIEDLRSK